MEVSLQMKIPTSFNSPEAEEVPTWDGHTDFLMSMVPEGLGARRAGPETNTDFRP
jgi:hypothetical protein